MNLFPFELIDKKSNVVLWGYNSIAQSFYQQFNVKSYCKLVLWTDPKFDEFQIDFKKPFGKTKDIQTVLYDYIIISTDNRIEAFATINRLIEMGINRESIIWDDYSFNEITFPIDYDKVLLNSKDYLMMISEYNRASVMVKDYFYQSLPQLGIQGVRNSYERIHTYGIDRIFNKNMNVLDIGCNTGFFDLCFADRVGSITAIDVDPYYIKVASLAKKMMDVKNVDFEECDIRKKQFKTKFDMVIACAVHNWIGLELEEFVELIDSLLNKDGYFLFESNSLEKVDVKFEHWINSFLDLNYNIVNKSRTVSQIGTREAYLLIKGFTKNAFDDEERGYI